MLLKKSLYSFQLQASIPSNYNSNTIMSKCYILMRLPCIIILKDSSWPTLLHHHAQITSDNLRGLSGNQNTLRYLLEPMSRKRR